MKMKVTISGTDGIKSLIKKRIDEVISDKSFKKEIANDVVFDIKRNARSGNQLKDGKSSPMDPLEPRSTIPHREYLREAGNATARPYIDQFSNLSMSGQLIDSVDAEITQDGFIVSASGERTPYITKKGTPSKARPISNEELSAIHHSGNASGNLPARPFIGLREEMRARIITKMREFLRRSFKINFNVKNGS